MSGGQLVVIKRSGRDGMRYPLPTGCVTLGRDPDCHIRVLLPTVSRVHATVSVHRDHSIITNESPTGETMVNGTAVSVLALAHNDVITLGDRSLRWEYYRPQETRTISLPKVDTKGGRRRKPKTQPGRASETAPRRLEPEVKALLEMRHRASMPGTRAERQVAIVQPQRRGESNVEPTEAIAVTKPANKRQSRASKAGTSSDSRKSARAANDTSVNVDNTNTSRNSSPRKSGNISQKNDNNSTIKAAPKKDEKVDTSLKTPTKKAINIPAPRKSSRNTPVVFNTKKSATSATKPRSPKDATPKELKTSKVATPKLKTPKAATPKLKTPKAATPKLKTPKVSTPKPTTPKVATPKPQTPKVDTPKLRQAKSETPKASIIIESESPRSKSPRVSTRKANIETPKSPKSTPKIAKVATPQSARVLARLKTTNVATPKSKTPKVETPKRKTAPSKPALDFSKVEAIDLAAVAARGTPKRGTPKGPYAHVATPRPKTPYVEESPSKIVALLPRSTRTPRVNPLLRAAITAKLTPRSVTKVASPRKRNVVEKIEEPAVIDAQKKSALMALTGRSPLNRKAGPKTTPVSGRKSGRGRRGPVTPRLRPGTPRDTGPRYKSASALELGAGDGVSISAGKKLETPRTTPTKRASVTGTSPHTHSPRRSALSPPTITFTSPSPIKSVLKSASSNSPRKNESIKFDLSNLERKSASPPKQNVRSPKRGRSVTSTDTASEEDMMLRFSDESSDTESPAPKRSRSKDTFISAHSRSSSKTSVSPRKSSRGLMLVQKVLESPIVVSPTPSDKSRQSTYSRQSTLTKFTMDASSVSQTPKNSTNKTQTPGTLPLSPRNTRQTGESYSIVDLVSTVETTRSVTDTSTDYDSASSVNSSFRTPLKSTRQSSLIKNKNISNISLETSTPVNRGRLSARKALLKSATIASAIKRSKSTPAAKPQSPSAKTPKRRSKSLTVSPKDKTTETRRSKRSEIVIEDSVMSNNTTLTPSLSISKSFVDSTAMSNGSFSKGSAKSKMSKSPNVSRKRDSKLIEESILRSPNETLHLSTSVQSLSSSTSRTSSRSNRSVSIAVSKKSITPKSFSKSKVTPASKRPSTSLSNSSSVTKRSSSRRSLTSPKLQMASGQSGPTTPENETVLSEAGTPVLNIQNFLNQSQGASKKRASVKETVKQFEALNTPQSAQQVKKVTRKTLGGIGERILARRSDFEVQSDRRVYSDSKKGRGITKRKTDSNINLNSLKKIVTRGKTRVSDENSISSDKTDENAPRPDNEIVITPKSSVQLVPEAVKDKHSTAKKSTSRKSIIDHLNESQEIVKQLFNSPVKRKLSNSMTHYSRTIIESNSSRASSRRSTLGKTPNVSFDFDNVKTPHVPTEMFVSPMETPTPPSPNLVGVKRLYARNTPKNDLRNVHGVRALLKTPANKKSPKNDLTNISGVKELLKSNKKLKSPANDLSKVSGVKQLFQSSKKTRSPKNDLTQVGGIKKLFASAAKKQKSPKNDLRNVYGVKKLLATPRGKQKSPKNDLTNVSGVRSVFRRHKSVANALDDVSGVEELFSNSVSTLNEQNVSDFDKLVGRSPLKSYGRAKSLVSKKASPAKPRNAKSLTSELSQNNVEEWLNKEIEKRTSNISGKQAKSLDVSSTSNTTKTPNKSVKGAASKGSTKKTPNKSLENTKSKSPAKRTPIPSTKNVELKSSSKKTPNKSIKETEPKSSKVQRALKKLTIDAVGGNVTITPGQRSRRTLTADKSNFSINVAKALTPPKKKLSTVQNTSERKSLPFKKRLLSKTPKSNTPQKSVVNLDDSTEALGLNKDRPSLPLKKRMISHAIIGTSTPVKKRTKTLVAHSASMELGPVSPIESSPNVTPRKSISLQEARRTVAQARASIRSAEKLNALKSNKTTPVKERKVNANKDSPNIFPKLPKSPKAKIIKERVQDPPKPAKTKKAPAKGGKGKAQVVANVAPKDVPSPAPKRRGRGAKNVPKSSPKLSPKKSTRARKQNVTNENVKVIVGKKAPKMSPEKPKASKISPQKRETQEPSVQKPVARRGRRTDPIAEISPVKEVAKPTKTRGRKAENTTLVEKPEPKRASLVIPKKTPKMSPEKPAAKSTRGRRAEPKPSPHKSPVKPASKTRGRKVVSPVKDAPKKANSKKTSRTNVAAKKAEEKTSPKKRQGKKGSQAQAKIPSPPPSPKKTRGKRSPPEVPASPVSVGRGRKKAAEKAVEIPVVKATKAGGKRKAEPKVATPTAKKANTHASKKQVRFAPETTKQEAAPARGRRRKAEPTAEEVSRPQAKRSRGGAASAPAPAPAPAPSRPVSKRGRAAPPSPAQRSGRPTRQRK